MPTYEYNCPDCNENFEIVQKISEDPLVNCPKCQGKNVKRLISASAFHLKGGGWYKTDYSSSSSSTTSRSTTKSPETSKDSSASTKESSSSSSETKAECTGKPGSCKACS